MESYLQGLAPGDQRDWLVNWEWRQDEVLDIGQLGGRVQPFISAYKQNASENEKGISVVDMVLPNKQWNWEAYARFLPM